MGFLSRFTTKTAAVEETTHLTRLTSGSFTVDAKGHVVASTLPGTFPAEHVNAIAQAVLSTFQNAQKAQLPLSEIIISYAALKISARELRGGAIIFLAPKKL
ncbi:MAG: hypothetical protein JWM68_4272 [Verrucomicrobiales bacterium]|nr:hypothetical protein [Verrucomicrobiales bacterium]